eukprot:5255137-Pyramimonas_sp.AAC.1
MGLSAFPGNPIWLWHFHPPNTALRGSIVSSTEAPSVTARMRSPPPSAALRGPLGSSTEENVHYC